MLKYLVVSMPGTNSMNSHGICERLQIFCFTSFVIFVHYTGYTKNAL
jgi:hypothetical protein